jgi:hypothetical protein
VRRHRDVAAEAVRDDDVQVPAPHSAGAGRLDTQGVLAMQSGVGNVAVSRLLVARQPTPVAPPPPAPAVTWHDAGLKLGVEDDTITSDAIFSYLMGLIGPARDTAIEDLKKARSEWRGQRLFPERIHKIDEVLQKTYRDVAKAQAPGVTAPIGGYPAGHIPPALTAGTHAPTIAEQDRLRDAMAPPRRTTSGGTLAPFRSKTSTATDAYEQRIFKALHKIIDELWDSQAKDKGPTEHADAANVNPWSRYEEIAEVAKDETNAVFGSYNRGPALKHGATAHSGNLRDRFEQEVASQAAEGPTGRLRQAETLVEYFLQSDERIEAINTEHDAIPERATLSPGETRSEAQILKGAVTTIGAARKKELLSIDRGWDATAGGGIVSLQRWKQATPKGQRIHFWDMMQTLIHEYLHTLTNAAYSTHANHMPGGSAGLQANTLIEGMTSAMTEIVWANVAGHVAALGPKVEGPDFVDAAHTLAAIPPIDNRRYGSFSQAMEMMSVVGPRNVYAAYFLGKVDLIKSSPVHP